jgi:hypothetical protein
MDVSWKKEFEFLWAYLKNGKVSDVQLRYDSQTNSH